MKIKAYHCDKVEAAVRQARLELGEEAILLESKKTQPDERHLGLYEVLFAAPGTGGVGALGAAPEPAAAGGSFAELRQGLEQIRRMLYSYTHTCYLPTGQFLSQPRLVEIYQDLTAQDVNPELAAQLLAGLTVAAERGASLQTLERSLAAELQAMIP